MVFVMIRPCWAHLVRIPLALAFPMPFLPIVLLQYFVVTSNPGNEVAQENDLVIPGEGGKGIVKIGVEPFLDFLIRIQSKSICTDDSGMLVSAEMQVKSYQPFTDTLREFGKHVSDLVPDGETDSVDMGVTAWFPFLEEGVASADLPQLSVLSKPGFAESSDVDVMPR
ncbi:hypothetical protein Y1Q_0015821 [Alligator mississippiensis]|uniref:Uncharacterized protein n=1 Tax=Alligator mississippiensis TaxID=8496 RepID=A0A151MH52_ALLMI|nr:hypothetical protein Y1Q_0015821 [Alligator mississippiensis]